MNEEMIFQWIGIAAVALMLGISGYFRRQAARSGERISEREEEGWLIFVLRAVFALALWGGILAYLVNPAWMRWAQFAAPVWLRWVGAGIVTVTPLLFYWMFSSLGKNITRTVAIRKEHQLVRHGPYRWIRHPLYTFGTLAVLGLGLMAANAFILAAGLLTEVVLYVRSFEEEARLVERFGDEYRRYQRSTGRFVPKIKG